MSVFAGDPEPGAPRLQVNGAVVSVDAHDGTIIWSAPFG